ncbi:MAG: hypothetical protein ABIL25_02340 [candidate division WOR-3 bacterium]
MRRIELEVQERFFGFDACLTQGRRSAEAGRLDGLVGSGELRTPSVGGLNRRKKAVEKEEVPDA